MTLIRPATKSLYRLNDELSYTQLQHIVVAFILTIIFPFAAYSEQLRLGDDIYSGHYAREGNNESPSSAINNNIYIKIFKNQWIALMYVPLPYAETLKPQAITSALQTAKNQTASSAYLRSKFGEFSELATVHIEKFGYLEDRLVFECGSLAPCTIQIKDGYLDLIKPGVINEHIIRYNHVLGQ